MGFLRLEKSKKLKQRRKPTRKNSGRPNYRNIQITPAAAEAITLAGFPEWPGKKETAVAEIFVQASINNYSRFMDALYDYAHSESGILAETADYIFNMIFPDPMEFAAGWYERINEMAKRWEGWDGDLLKWVWRPRLKKAKRELWHFAEEFSGKRRDYERILENSRFDFR